MDIPNSFLKYFSISLFVAIVLLLVFGAVQKKSYESKVLELQNSLANKDKTIEVHQGNFEKLAVEHKNLQDLLDQKDKQINVLSNDLKRSGEKLLTANSLSLNWKNAYEALVKASQENIKPVNQDGPARTKVSFLKDWSYIRAYGYTLSDPPEAYIKIEQLRPLKLNVIVGRQKDGSWKSQVTSSEENMSVDITMAAVDPSMFDKKWYERIGTSVDLGVGSNGFIGSFGLSLQIDKFDIGPKVFLSVGNSASVFYGASVTWHPWAQ